MTTPVSTPTIVAVLHLARIAFVTTQPIATKTSDATSESAPAQDWMHTYTVLVRRP